MLYAKDITFPKGKTEATASVTKLKIWSGVIHQIDVVFPAGCGGRVHLYLSVGGHQIAPVTKGSDFSGDNATISYREFLEIDPGGNVIDIVGWNESQKYDHRIIIRIGVLPKEVLMPEWSQKGIIASLKSMIYREK